MLKGAIARRYAQAIFEIGRKQNTLDRTLDDVREIARLFAHRKLAYLMQNIARELEQLVLDDKNQAIAQVTTATKLDEAQLTLVKKALEGRTGKTILMQTKVEPDILGGVIARVGDQIIDGSVRYRLAALQQQLLTGVASSNVDLPFARDAMEQPTSVVSNGSDATAGAPVLTSQEPETDNVKPKQRAKPRRKQKK